MKLKKSIVMLMVPAFVLAGCAKDDSVAVASNVAQTPEGAFVQVADTLNKSYEEAKAKGYTGTYEDWVKLLELHKTDPAAATQAASNSGFSGMDMMMAGTMGMMLGNMMSNGSYNSFKSRQQAMGSSAYVPPARNTLNSYRATESRAVSTKAAAVSRSTSTSRGGFGGAVSSGG